MGKSYLNRVLSEAAAKGRHGDDVLVHMSRDEVRNLNDVIPLTINPDTGLPEMFSWGDALSFIAPVASSLVGSYVAPMIFDGASTLGTGLVDLISDNDTVTALLGGALDAGVGAGVSALAGGNPWVGAGIGGLGSYAAQTGMLDSLFGRGGSGGVGMGGGASSDPLSSWVQGVNADGSAAGVMPLPPPAPPFGGDVDPDTDLVRGLNIPSFRDARMASTRGRSTGRGGSGQGSAERTPLETAARLGVAALPVIAGMAGGVGSNPNAPGGVNQNSNAPNAPAGFSTPLPSVRFVRNARTPQVDWLTAAMRPGGISFFDNPSGTFVAAKGGMAAINEMNRPSTLEGRRRQSTLRSVPDGGRPRVFDGPTRGGESYLRGPDGGQDDTVPSRLSHGEYVWDATTVADIGDGNSEAGAKKLDQLRDKIASHKGRRERVPRKTGSLIAHARNVGMNV